MRYFTLSGRRRSAVLVFATTVALTTALVAPAADGVEKVVRIGKPGPEVPGVAINGKAALAGPNCDPTVQRIKIVFVSRPPCVTPWAAKNNGGATASGVTKDSIKVVVYAASDEEIRQGPSTGVPTNRATGAPGDFSQAVKDMLAVFAHGEWETYGRNVDLEIVTRSGTDEAAQRADALAVSGKKPFYVADLTTGGSPIFAAAVANSKIIVQSAAGTAEDAAKQAPYRWLGAGDPNGPAINAGEFAKKSLVGKPARFGGDDVKSKTRKFGVIYPDTGIDVSLFLDQLPKNSYVTASYTLPAAATEIADEIQRQAGTLIPKMKSSGVTTMVLFGPYQATAPLATAATTQEYTPEWFIPGNLGIDVSLLGRSIDQDQWAHAFGIGQLFPPIVGEALNQNTAYFNWYWGPDSGTYQSTTLSAWSTLFRGVMFAGPKLSPKTFQQGMFSVPASGGAATGNTQNYLTGYGPAAGVPYDEYGALGYDFYTFWWDPQNVGVSNIVAANGTGRYAYLNSAKRYAVGTWPKGEPKFFDKSASIYEETASETPTAEQATLPTVDRLPVYPCEQCPSSGGTTS